MQIKLVVVDHNHTCNLLNISALHVQYGIRAVAKFKRSECTRSHRRELQSQKFSRGSMRPKLPKKRVGSLSRVIKVYQEMYQNSHVMPCIAI